MSQIETIEWNLNGDKVYLELQNVEYLAPEYHGERGWFNADYRCFDEDGEELTLRGFSDEQARQFINEYFQEAA